MSGNGRQRTPTIDTEWEDLTNNHEERREFIESSIDDWPEDIVQASYVIGAIGAGKTQLLTHLFKYSYVSSGTPALYVTMGQLLDDIERMTGYPDEIDIISQEKLHDTIEQIVEEKCEEINRITQDGSEFSRDNYLLDSGRLPSVDDYIKTLGVDREQFSEITAQDRAVLIIDEMEESYNRLGDMVAQTTGPLREVVERVERGNSSFYLIGGFGYASVHELGEAEYRRVNPITLPIIKPQSIEGVLGGSISTRRRNFIWWMSRGRPGWLEIADNGYEMHPESFRGGYELLGDIPVMNMSRVDIIALEELEEKLQKLGEVERDLTAYTIFHPSPTDSKQITDLDHGQLDGTSAPVLIDSILTSLDDVAEAFLTGAKKHSAYDEASVSDQLVRRYLVRILRAMSNEDEELVFGAAQRPVFQRGNICQERMLGPLAERIHDIALEETGDDEQATVDFLYELSQHTQGADAEELSADFSDFFDLFTDSGSVDDEASVGPGLGILVTAFPSLITNPRLNFASTGQSVTEQFEEAVKQLGDQDDHSQRLVEFGEILQEGEQ